MISEEESNQNQDLKQLQPIKDNNKKSLRERMIESAKHLSNIFWK